MLHVPVTDQHVLLVLPIIIDQQRQHVLYVQVSQIVRNVQIMPINVQLVQQDIIQMEPRVNYVILFMQNAPHVQQQQRHVLNVQQDITWHHQHHVPPVQVKWQTVPNVPQMEVNVRNVPVDIIQKEHHVNYVIQ